MRFVALLCFLLSAVVGYSAAIELDNGDLGLRAYEIDTSEGYEAKLLEEAPDGVGELTKVVQGREGCTWSHFETLLDLVKGKRYPVVLLAKIAIAKQLRSCDNEVLDLPESVDLDHEERNKLAEFGRRITRENLDNLDAVIKGILKFIKEDHHLTFKTIKKQHNKRQKFNEIFYKEMQFCHSVVNKLHHYFEFAHQVMSPQLDLEKKMPLIAERVNMGLACLVYVNNQKKLNEMAFEKTMGKWYRFKKVINEIRQTEDDYL